MISCPSDQELREFALGKGTPESIEALGEHLESCEVCSGKLDAFDHAPDDLIQHLRQQSHGTVVDAEYDRLLQDVLGEVPNVTSDGSSSPSTVDSDQEVNGTTDPVAVEHPERISRYRIEKVLGKGGFGLVYLAYDEQLDRLVAIKVPHVKLISKPEDANAYLTEARTVANLDHPHIVPVYDIGATENHPCYIVSKYIEGTDLTSRLKESRLTYRDAAELVATVAGALHYAHKLGLVHRDVKPGNILVDGDGKPFVVDFGLALREENIGKGPKYAGTPAYMSPEQARGEGHRVDGRSDILSLGVVFYELLVGRRPFRGDTTAELIEQVTSYEPRPPRQYDDRIPKELERICYKALAKRASERYTTAKDFTEDLWLYLADQTVVQSKVSPGGVVPETDDPQAGSTAIGSSTGTSSSTGLDSSQSHPIKIVPKGLRSFDAHDADFFLELLPGPRDRNGLPDSLRFWKTRIEETDSDNTFSVGLIYGPSGCGKSSLVKAGLLPNLSEDVIPVYIEATPDETENRLLRGLRKKCPALEDNISLKDSLAVLRRGQGIPVGKKVLIVLDQFEQWLHAQSEDENTDLVQALRQCDGSRVQCIVMVRDDFWLAVSRFLRELEVCLVEGHNSALVDLFDTDHSRKVLAAFGRAFGKLPDNLRDTTREQKDFLNQSVEGLAEEGKVVCVRLALFAEMMKGKTWTPATLKAVGGTRGVGVTFLEETFSSSTSSPEHRYHQKGARAVLKELLPESGSDIKGYMRSFDELLEASGYGNRLQDFEELIRILDSGIRLITPTDPEGKDADDDSVTQTEAGEKYFQLTHDYLVHSLRDWLTRKQKETRKGRAELKLFDTSVTWNAKPENRFLPSWREFLSIRLLTDNKRWTEPQRKMMGRAGRVHGISSTVVTVTFAALVFSGVTIRNIVNERQYAAVATGLLEGLLQADTSQLKTSIENLADYRQYVRDDLQKAYTKSTDDSNAKLHAALAILREDDSVLPFLKERLLTVSPGQFEYVRNLMENHKNRLIADYWIIAKDITQDPTRRFQAACCLSSYDSENEYWNDQGFVNFVVNHLVDVLPSELLPWRNALLPVTEHLTAQLTAIYRDDSLGEQVRGFATDTLADYLNDDAHGLFDLLANANEKQFEPIFNRLIAYEDQAIELGNAEIEGNLSVSTDWTIQFYKWKSVNQKLPADWNAVLSSPVLQELQTHRLSINGSLPTPPARNVPALYFAARATTEVLLEGVPYTLSVTFDDGVRVSLDDEVLFEDWTSNATTTKAVRIQDKRGRHQIKIEHFQIAGEYALGVDIQLAEAAKRALAIRQANAAIMLLRMDAAERVWPLLKHSPDPRVRSYITHWLCRRGGDPRAIIDRFEKETDVTIKRALLLCLGEFDKFQVVESERKQLIELYLTIYRSDPDAGLHGAVEWLLRKWGVTLPELPVGELVLTKEDKQELTAQIAKVADIQQQRVESEQGLPDRQVAWERKLAEQAELPASLNEGLVAHYPLDGPDGTEVANTVEEQRSGVYVGREKPDWRQGVVGNALRLDGNGGHVACDQAFVPKRTDEFSYGCWFFADSHSKRGVLLGKFSNAAQRGFAVNIDPVAGDIICELSHQYPINALVVRASVPDLVGSWHHLFVSYDGSSKAEGVTVCIDGLVLPLRTEVDSLSKSLQVSAPFQIGKRDNVYAFQGYIDEVRVYSRQLDHEDVLKLFAAGLRAMARIPQETRTPEQLTALAKFHPLDKQLQRLPTQLAAAKAAVSEALHERWYVNSQGQTFVILNADEFMMGSLMIPNERLHRRKIGRQIAIAATEVTREQWRRFYKATGVRHPDPPHLTFYSRTDDSPIILLTWYDAAHYCNWLSQQEKIPKDQWCYEKNKEGRYSSGMKAKDNFLELSGYRLPTQAEWEYACRAGASTSRYYGVTESLLTSYAWYMVNSEGHSHPVAWLRPNDYGLFDMHGNVMEWCYDGADELSPPFFSRSPSQLSRSIFPLVIDLPSTIRVEDASRRTARDGTYGSLAGRVRSAITGINLLPSDKSSVGLRPVRTFTNPRELIAKD